MERKQSKHPLSNKDNLSSKPLSQSKSQKSNDITDSKSQKSPLEQQYVRTGIPKEINEEIRKKKLESFKKLRTKIAKEISTRSPQYIEDKTEIEEVDPIKLYSRSIHFGDEFQILKNNKSKHNNKVKTQKYTLLSWAPNPVSMISTFAFVLIFSMMKEAYEDFQRYKHDKEVNNKTCTILNLNSMKWVEKKWENIQPGHILRVTNDQEAPADIAIITSSGKGGIVFVDTMNLDGETNLKEKNAIHRKFHSTDLKYLVGEIKCEKSTENLEKWEAQIFYQSKKLESQAIGIKHLLMRGSYLKNTEYAIGIVVYSGMETKIMRNLKKPRFKVSNIMRMMNKMLLTVFAFQITLIFVFAGLDIYWINQNAAQHSYLNITQNLDNNTGAGNFFLQLLIFWVAYSHMIPISLYIMIEILKLGQAAYINKDLEMYDVQSNTLAKCKNSDLIEELGQVEMIFCDKTGTLTQNQMVFKKFQINGIKYGEPNSKEEVVEHIAKSGISEVKQEMKREAEDPNSLYDKFPYCTEFMQLLAICNTVVCEKNALNKGEIIYKGTSTDEIALVEGANLCGMQLKQRTHKRIKIKDKIAKKTHQLIVKAIFPFNYMRRRMSIIVKDKQGKYKILTKGSDSVMMDKISWKKNRIQSLDEIVEEDLYSYSSDGFRTLVIAMKRLSKYQYQDIKKQLKDIQKIDTPEKDDKLNRLYEEYEVNLRYLGITAIEDKLQEGVSVAIQKLISADIRFFMLTGDKLETAVQIARSCQLIQQDMSLILLGVPDREKIFKRLYNIVSRQDIDIADQIYSLSSVELQSQYIIVEGSCLTLIMEDTELKSMFFHIGLRSKSIICCRMSPKQKADLVQLFKSRGAWVTLAIGDGVNDVSMITEAHIGVGIRGKEGSSATRSADFSISQFQFLWRLLLYQGRNGYIRVSKMICYYFYKNIVLVFTEFYFAIYSGFSGQIFFLDWLPMLYNTFYTSWHCIFTLLLEKDINEHYSFRFPSTYKSGQLNYYFNFKIFWQWIIFALWHGAVCFYSPLMVANQSLEDSGKKGEHWLYSTISFAMIIHLVFYKLVLETTHFNYIQFMTALVSLGLFYGSLLISQIPEMANLLQPQILGVVQQMVQFPYFWMLIIGGPLMCLAPDIFFKNFFKVFFPSPIDKILHCQKLEPNYNFKEHYQQLEKTLQVRKRQNTVKTTYRRKIIELRTSMQLTESYLYDEENLDKQMFDKNESSTLIQKASTKNHSSASNLKMIPLHFKDKTDSIDYNSDLEERNEHPNQEDSKAADNQNDISARSNTGLIDSQKQEPIRRTKKDFAVKEIVSDEEDEDDEDDAENDYDQEIDPSTSKKKSGQQLSFLSIINPKNIVNNIAKLKNKQNGSTKTEPSPVKRKNQKHSDMRLYEKDNLKTIQESSNIQENSFNNERNQQEEEKLPEIHLTPVIKVRHIKTLKQQMVLSKSENQPIIQQYNDQEIKNRLFADAKQLINSQLSIQRNLRPQASQRDDLANKNSFDDRKLDIDSFDKQTSSKIVFPSNLPSLNISDDFDESKEDESDTHKHAQQIFKREQFKLVHQSPQQSEKGHELISIINIGKEKPPVVQKHKNRKKSQAQLNIKQENQVFVGKNQSNPLNFYKPPKRTRPQTSIPNKNFRNFIEDSAENI